MTALDTINHRVQSLALGIPVSIRISPRARRLSLRVDAASRGIELVLPLRFSAETALSFVSSHRGWIATRIAAMPAPRHLGDGATVPVCWRVPHRVRRELDTQRFTGVNDRQMARFACAATTAHISSRRVRRYLVA